MNQTNFDRWVCIYKTLYIYIYAMSSASTAAGSVLLAVARSGVCSVLVRRDAQAMPAPGFAKLSAEEIRLAPKRHANDACPSEVASRVGRSKLSAAGMGVK